MAQAATGLGLPAGEDMAMARLATGKKKSQVPGAWPIPLPPPGHSAPAWVMAEVQALLSFGDSAPSYMQILRGSPRLSEQGLLSPSVSASLLQRLTIWEC